MVQDMENIIESLKRLEKTGGENYQITHKLIDAAGQLSRKIVDQFSAQDEYILDIAPRWNHMRYSIQNGRLANKDSRYVAENRETALAFATDVANGLLDAIAEILERRKTETREALKVMESALKK